MDLKKIQPLKDDTSIWRTQYLSIQVNCLLSRQKLIDLNNSHFQSHHRYRIEWQPGPSGYLEWYLDDNFIMGVDASVLDLTGALIPEVFEVVVIILTMIGTHVHYT